VFLEGQTKPLPSEQGRMKTHHEILHGRDLHPNMVILGSLTSPAECRKSLSRINRVAAEAGLF
jgi:hypothetical protein